MLNVVVKPFRPHSVGDLYASEDVGALVKLERMGLILRLEREKVLESLGVEEGNSQDAHKTELGSVKAERDALKAKLDEGVKGYDALQAHSDEGVKLLAEVEAARQALEAQNADLKLQLEARTLPQDTVLEPSTAADTPLENTVVADPAAPPEPTADPAKRPPKGK